MLSIHEGVLVEVLETQSPVADHYQLIFKVKVENQEKLGVLEDCDQTASLSSRFWENFAADRYRYSSYLMLQGCDPDTTLDDLVGQHFLLLVEELSDPDYSTQVNVLTVLPHKALGIFRLNGSTMQRQIAQRMSPESKTGPFEE